MPKNFRGENSKAVSAKERKACKAAEEKEQKLKKTEDAKWVDDDKNFAKKSMRKEDKERKKQEDIHKKLELKLLEEDENASLAPATKSAPVKMTQYQLQQLIAKKEEVDNGPVLETHLTTPLMENTNRDEAIVSATGVEAAIRVLSCDDIDGSPSSSHGPKVNMAAAYRSFEEKQMPVMKKEFPTLKLSQLKMKIKKDWQKSPINPVNQIR